MSMVRRDVEAGGRRRKSRDALTSRPEIERLLDVARAPASPRELAGEREAVDLFAHARLVSSGPSPEVATASSRHARTGFKAALAAAGAVGLMSSGVAFAATGHVPFSDTLQHMTRQLTGHADDDASPSADGQAGTDPASPNGPKAAALQGLCHAYVKGQKAGQGKALERRPFRTLVAAAGGEDQVDAFCASLPPKAHQGGPGPSHPAHPSHPTHPTHPTNGPSDEPSNAQTDHPTHPAHPTKKPHPTHPAHPTKKPHPTHPTKKPHPTHPTKKPHPTHPTKSAHPTHPTKKAHPSTTPESTE
jgi:hypothetical protein